MMPAESTQSPQVTVVVPCYNVARFLPQCLDSLLAQTYGNLRIIAVDDCSPDNSAEIIRGYEKKDPRVKGIYHEVNGGVSVARNDGIRQTDTPWIFFLDGDDWLPEDALERLLELQRGSDADVVCCNMLEYNEDGSANGKVEYPLKGRHLLEIRKDGMDFVAHQSILCICTAKLFRTSLLRESGILFHEQLRHAQDTLFTHTVVLKCRPRVLMDYDCMGYCYRQFAQSCVHAIRLDRRLDYIRLLVTRIDGLATELGYSRRLTARKCAEYFWAIRKFAQDGAERRRRTAETVESPFFREHLAPVLAAYAKPKHRLLLWLFRRGCFRWISLW